LQEASGDQLDTVVRMLAPLIPARDPQQEAAAPGRRRGKPWPISSLSYIRCLPFIVVYTFFWCKTRRWTSITSPASWRSDIECTRQFPSDWHPRRQEVLLLQPGTDPAV